VIGLSQDNKNRVKGDFLLLLLTEIEANGNNIKLVAENLKWSKQRLNYHLNTKLKKLGLVQKTQSYPYAIYSLTPFGQRVKKIIGQSDSLSTLWRCHGLIVGFDIKDFGNFSWEKRKLSSMKGWNYYKEKIKDSFGEWVIDIQSTGLLKIYCPEQYTENPDSSFGRMERLACKIAEKYAEVYGMKLGLLKQIREGHKELVNSELLGKLFGTAKIGDMWADASTGTLWLEEKQSSNSIESLLKLPERMEKVEKIFTELLVPSIEKQSESNVWLAENLAKHEQVLNKMLETLQKIDKSLDKTSKPDSQKA